jgi:hypothetical protein
MANSTFSNGENIMAKAPIDIEVSVKVDFSKIIRRKSQNNKRGVGFVAFAGLYDLIKVLIATSTDINANDYQALR